MRRKLSAESALSFAKDTAAKTRIKKPRALKLAAFALSLRARHGSDMKIEEKLT